MNDRSRGAILALPTSVSGQLGPVASWVSTAGWAGGFRRVVGNAWIVTPDGEIDITALRNCASSGELSSQRRSTWRRRIPPPVKTGLKDVREWRRARAFRLEPNSWRNFDVRFVWQRHEIFHHAGPELARALGVPSVMFVPATLVWQAQQWGVKRPGWNRFVEDYGEARVLRRGDILAAGSDIVAEELVRLGVDERRIIITRTGFDPDVFTGVADGRAVREQLGISDNFVVGWIGSFRRFHAVDQLVHAVAAMASDAQPAPALLLVGDGPEHHRIIELARTRDVRTVSTGTVAHTDLPSLIAAMDVAVLSAAKDVQFHYSPLKLAEYLASGVAVVAPRAGRIPDEVNHGVEALLFDPGDVRELARMLEQLRKSPEERARLASAARAAAEDRFSWDHAARQVMAAVERLGTSHIAAGRILRNSPRQTMF